MAIIQIILLVLTGWLLMKLMVRAYAVFKVMQKFLTATKGYNRSFNSQQHASSTQKSNDSKKKAHMVECAKCSLYIPEHESYFNKGKYYCCKEHSQ